MAGPYLIFLLLVGLLSACGGGGGGSDDGPSDFEQGIFRDAALYKDLCANPRRDSPDRRGSVADENDWLRAWSHDLYLWYDEIADQDPELFDTPEYFQLMRTTARTPSGSAKDNFHFALDTEEWRQLVESGVFAGYGMDVRLVRAAPPRRLVVSFVEPGSPADGAVVRGTRIVEVDGLDLENTNSPAELDRVNAGLFPAADGESHSFVVVHPGGNVRETIRLVSAEIVQDPVPEARILETPAGRVGYLLFNRFIATAEARLVDVISSFAEQGIADLVLDMRYNGGGFLGIASQLSFMIAGAEAASGQPFSELQFNDKHGEINPFTGEELVPDPFFETTFGFTLEGGLPLPTLDLDRVFILSSFSTCSASEAVINGLRGIDVEVILVGEPTCGKPYGFIPVDNCGTTYFTIHFRGVNAKGFGDFTDGFMPTSAPREPWEVLGCVVADDLDHPLGDADEARLATALEFMESGACGSRARGGGGQAHPSAGEDDWQLREPVRLPGAVYRP